MEEGEESCLGGVKSRAKLQKQRQKREGVVTMGETGGHDSAGLWNMGILPGITMMEGWD